MSLFSKILEKLGLRKEKVDDQPATSTARPPTTTTGKPTTSIPSGGASAVRQTPVVAPVAPKAISEVDVVKQLEQKAKGTGLNWKQSIVDLLTLLDIDHDREARIELAKELGAPADVMSDSARMNTWLHKTVLKKIAENGGNIPANRLD